MVELGTVKKKYLVTCLTATRPANSYQPARERWRADDKVITQSCFDCKNLHLRVGIKILLDSSGSNFVFITLVSASAWQDDCCLVGCCVLGS
jgi:hypothetical protein